MRTGFVILSTDEAPLLEVALAAACADGFDSGLVIDNASSDDTAAVAGRWDVPVLRLDRRGGSVWRRTSSGPTARRRCGGRALSRTARWRAKCSTRTCPAGGATPTSRGAPSFSAGGRATPPTPSCTTSAATALPHGPR